jgi:hypothetical protein
MFKAMVLSIVFVLVPLSGALAAYTSTMTILEKKDIAKLADDQLINTYMDALVEVEARRGFFLRFGMTGKDLDEYKSVMKYRLLLLMEIHSRNLDIPQFERY